MKWLVLIRNAACPLPLTVALYLAPCFALMCDTIVLRSGQNVDGQVVGQDAHAVTIRTARGIRRVAKKEIRRIIYSDRVRPTSATQHPASTVHLLPKRRPAPPENERKSGAGPGVAGPFALAWRAAILPGWGHEHAGQNGGYIGGGFGVLLTAAALVSTQTIQARSAYENAVAVSGATVLLASATNPTALFLHGISTESYYRRYRTSAHVANSLWYATGMFYVLQIGHAMWLAATRNSSHGSSAHGSGQEGLRADLVVQRGIVWLQVQSRW